MDTVIGVFKEKIGIYNDSEQAKIIQTMEWVEQHGGDPLVFGKSLVPHSLEVAELLLQLSLDSETLMAALLLHCTEEPGMGEVPPRAALPKHPLITKPLVSLDRIQERFGNTIALLIKGVVQLAAISAATKTHAEAEKIRKMLFAMAQDIRVIFIKLADVLARLRRLDTLPREQRRSLAQECLDIYAPLADRLGISWIKVELEDRSLKQLNQKVYQQIKGIVSQKRAARNEFLAHIQGRIQQEAEALGITLEISSRAKHFYSIYQKMRKRNKAAGDIFDLFGIRILCDRVETCYDLLGMVHRFWKPLEGRFKDYIAMPKSNGYQSLHTTVMSQGGELLEIQIRTREMHHIAEYGAASHWLYKKGSPREILGSLDISNKTREAGLGSFLEDIKREFLKDSIYVLTPLGKVIELPRGSTAIDFAYSIHSAIGDHCMAAKAGGQIIPLDTPLQNTQTVEILTAAHARPHLNWLRTAKTPKARNRIRAWFQRYDSAIIEKNAAPKRKQLHPSPENAPKEKEREPQPIQRLILPGDSRICSVKAGDERNLMIRFAQCCCPMRGEPIVGYISRGRGIVIHRKNCPNLGGLPDFPERRITTEWVDTAPALIKRFRVEARLSGDIFSEIEGAVKKYQGHVIEGRLEEISGNRMICFFTMHLERPEEIKGIMKNLQSIPAVFTIQSL